MYLEKNKNLAWVDWVKAICIFFVYWLHVDTFSDWPKYTPIPYGAFFVNAFFFVSGYLMLRKFLSLPQTDSVFYVNRNKSFESTIYKIAIPSIIFSVIDFVPKNIVRGGGFRFFELFFESVIRGTHWFTCALVVSQTLLLIFISIKGCNKAWRIFILSIFAFTIGWLVNKYDITIMGDKYAPWFYKSGFMATLFLAVGGIYWRYENLIDRYLLYKKWIPFAVFLAYITLSKLSKVFGWKYATSVLQGIDIVGVLVSILAIFSVVGICKLLTNNRIITWIGRHTIGFYFLSASVPFACVKLCKMIPNSVAFYLCVLLSFFISWALIWFIDRYIPFMFDAKKLFKKNE